jgi:hypothetical protein
MKKLIMALTVATVFTACGDNSTKTDVMKSDSTVTKDSSSMMNSAPAPVVVDTTKMDSSHLKTDAPAK